MTDACGKGLRGVEIGGGEVACGEVTAFQLREIGDCLAIEVRNLRYAGTAAVTNGVL